jgi:hypothetical protein
MENAVSVQISNLNKERIVYLLEVGTFIVLILTIGLVYFATYYPDQGWGGDFAQYIHQAINISEGVDMAFSVYIFLC